MCDDTTENLHVTCESAAVIVISRLVLRGIISITIVKLIQLKGLLFLFFFSVKKKKQTLLCEFIGLHPPEGNELKIFKRI